MRTRFKILLGLLLSALTVGVTLGPVASAAQPRVNFDDTFAGISCTTLQGFPAVASKGWGVDYDPGIKIDVHVNVDGPGAVLGARVNTNNHETTLFTDNNGAWSSPTYFDIGGSGGWSVVVDVFRSSDGILLGTEVDSVNC